MTYIRAMLIFAVATAASMGSPAHAGIRANLAPYKPNGWSAPLTVTMDENDNALVSWAVVNNGSLPAFSEFRIRIYLDGVYVGGWRIGSLKSSYYVWIKDFQLPGKMTDGRHTLEVFADATDTVWEGNENDNRYTVTFDVITDEPLAWGAKVSAKFRERVRDIADGLGCDPSFLMAAMAFETGETFSPSITNAAGSGAIGLIQFMPSTATGLGTTTERLATMTAERQLDYVESYFASSKGKLDTLEDVYMKILWPAAIGRSDTYVLFSKPSIQYTQNRGLDGNGDGAVTKAEAAAPVRNKLVKGLKSPYVQ